MDIFENIPETPTGYDSLGNEKIVELGTVAVCRLPKKAENGEVNWCMVAMPIGSKALNIHLKVKALKEAVKLVGLSEKLENATDETLRDWAVQYVHKSKESKFVRYYGAAETHKLIESSVSYVLESSSGSVPIDLFKVIEKC